MAYPELTSTILCGPARRENFVLRGKLQATWPSRQVPKSTLRCFDSRHAKEFVVVNLNRPLVLITGNASNRAPCKKAEAVSKKTVPS